jgi:dolichol-phosphate mannosyltransferase
MTVWVLLPAFNEAAAIAVEIRTLTRSLAGHSVRIVVVDDGSEDETARLAEEMAPAFPVEVLRHCRNRGLGCALDTGLRHILQQGRPPDALVIKDADGTHPSSLVPRMLRELKRGRDVVVASRYRRGAQECGLVRRRRFLSLVANTVYALVEPIPGVRDYTCGFRAFRLAVLARAHRNRPLVEARGFGATPELLLKAAAAGARASEVPLVLRYDRKAGPSKMRTLQAMRENLGVLWKTS